MCPYREAAYRMLTRLQRSGLGATRLYSMVAKEMDRDLLEGVSRLALALPKAEPLFVALVEAGRNKRLREEALCAIRSAKMRVR